MSGQPAKILVLDGNLVGRKFYTRLLKHHYDETCEILETDMGKRALGYLEIQEIDCILAAYQLPDMTAFDFLTYIEKEGEEGYILPIFVISDDSGEAVADKAMTLGAYDYLVKGTFSPISLAHKITNAIEKTRLRKQLTRSRQQLLDTAHRAGMAEIANGVLHNIGNHMNSVATSVDSIFTTLGTSKLKGFVKANELLGDMEDLLAQHPKGKGLIQYFRTLQEMWEKESVSLQEEADSLMDKVTCIRNDILAQTRFANSDLFLEEMDVATVVHEALKLQAGRLEDAEVNFDEHHVSLPRCKVVHVKLLHILNNLITNSIDSLVEYQPKEKRLHLEIRGEDERHYAIDVVDNGEGIKEDIREQIFHYGYSTRDGSQGVGLHVAANAAAEMGGRLTVQSDGYGKGCTFTLILPYEASSP